MRPAAALTVVFVCAAGLALAFAPGDGAWAADQDIKISSMVSDLQRIQVEMAMGDKTAYARQIDRLHAIGEAIDAAPGPVQALLVRLTVEEPRAEPVETRAEPGRNWSSIQTMR